MEEQHELEFGVSMDEYFSSWAVDAEADGVEGWGWGDFVESVAEAATDAG